MLYKQIYDMYIIKYMKEKNISNINQIVNVHPYVFEKLTKLQNNYTKKHLTKLLNDICTYDYDSKIGNNNFEIGIKKIICDI